MGEPAWLEEARQKRAEAEKVWETIPSADHFTRGQVIEALTRLGQTSATISGTHYEGDEFFNRICTNDLRSLLRDHWYLQVRGGENIHPEPPDVPDVPEPDIRPTSCRCNCGYSCGGPGKCDLPLLGPEGCINQHYVRDCDHDWSGPWVDFEDDNGGSVTCATCGMDLMSHDMICGP